MTVENQRFIDEFLPLFDNDLHLNDIPNLLKVRDSFEIESLNKYLKELDKPKRKEIFNRVFAVLISEYIPHMNITPQPIVGYRGMVDKADIQVIARLKSNQGEYRYLAIGDYVSDMKVGYGAPDFQVVVCGYNEHGFIGREFNHYVEYGTWNYIDYYFFNCLNLQTGVIFDNVESNGEYTYEFDTLTFDFNKDHNFDFTGIKDDNGKDIYDKDLVWIQFNDTHKYKTVIDFDKNSGRCSVSRPELGMFAIINAKNSSSDVIYLEKV